MKYIIYIHICIGKDIEEQKERERENQKMYAYNK